MSRAQFPTSPNGRTSSRIGSIGTRTSTVERTKLSSASISGVTGGGTVVDATASIKGKLKLAGHFAGTADTPILNTAADPQTNSFGLGIAAAGTAGSLKFLTGPTFTGTTGKLDLDRGLNMNKHAPYVDPLGGQRGDGSNVTLQVGPPVLDGRYPTALNYATVHRMLMGNLTSISNTPATFAVSGTNGIRDRGAGTIQTTGTAVTGTGTNLVGSGGKKLVAVAAPGGVYTTWEGTIAASPAPTATGATLTGSGMVDRVTGLASNVPAGTRYSVDPGNVNSQTVSIGGTFPTGDGPTFFHPFALVHYMRTEGSLEQIEIGGEIQDAAGSGTNEYGEFYGLGIHTTSSRLGALIGSIEVGPAVTSGKQSKLSGYSVFINDANSYTSYAGAFGGTGGWEDTAGRAFWIQNNSLSEAGTGIYIADPGPGFRRNIVCQTAGVGDLFTVDRYGSVGIGSADDRTGLTAISPLANQDGYITHPLVVSKDMGTGAGFATYLAVLRNANATGSATLALTVSHDGLTNNRVGARILFKNTLGNRYSIRMLGNPAGSTFQIYNEAHGLPLIQVKEDDTVYMTNVTGSNTALNVGPAFPWDASVGTANTFVRLQTILPTTTFPGGDLGTRTAGNRTNDDNPNTTTGTFWTGSHSESVFDGIGSHIGYTHLSTMNHNKAALTIASLSTTGSPTTVTTTTPHGLSTNDQVYISGSSSATLNGHTWIVASTPLTTTFTITVANSTASAIGSVQPLQYHENTGVQSNIIGNSRGGYISSFESWITGNVPGKHMGHFSQVQAQTGGAWSDFTGTDGTNIFGTSTWTQTGHRGFWALSSGTAQAGTAYYANDLGLSGGGWKYFLLLHTTTGSTTLGTTKFSVTGAGDLYTAGSVTLDLSASSSLTSSILYQTTLTAAQNALVLGLGQTITLSTGGAAKGFAFGGTFTIGANDPATVSFSGFNFNPVVNLTTTTSDINAPVFFTAGGTFTAQTAAVGNVGGTPSAFAVNTAFTSTGGGTATLPGFIVFNIAPTFDAGWVTTAAGEVVGLSFKPTETTPGNVKNFVGIDVGALDAATLNLSLRSTGTAEMRHGGTAVFAANAAPTNASVGLEVQSTTKAFLASRMTGAQMNALTAADGMIVYVTDNATVAGPNFYKRLNGAWATF